jgi:hypothetical protein
MRATLPPTEADRDERLVPVIALAGQVDAEAERRDGARPGDDVVEPVLGRVQPRQRRRVVAYAATTAMMCSATTTE